MTAPPLAGRLAVVTGASRGIGLAIAREMHRAGAHVVRLARSLADGETDRQTDFRCDVTLTEDVERAAGSILSVRGAPDILVNNAGLFLLKPLADTTPAEFRAQVEGSLVGPFMVLRAFIGAMVARGSGLVVTIGSVADHRALAGNAAYGSAKRGLRGLHEVLAAELEGTGVRATLLSPGPVDTALWDAAGPQTRPGLIRRADMLRVEDIAETVLFLATRAARVHVTELRLEPAR